jgi:hypothetical protein
LQDFLKTFETGLNSFEAQKKRLGKKSKIGKEK